MTASFADRLRQSIREQPVTITPKVRLPGDSLGLVRALHVLADAGLLAPNVIGAYELTAPCPRCGRATAVYRSHPPSVCTGCRAEDFAARVALLNGWDT